MIAEVKKDEPAWSCCPLMSGAPIPIKPPNGQIMQPNQVAIAPMIVPCVEEGCPLFDPQERVCKLQSVSQIASSLLYMTGVFTDLKLVLEPPKDSPSPLMRVAQSLEKIVENLTKKD